MGWRHGKPSRVDILSVSVTDATGPLYFHVTTEAHDQNKWGRCSRLELTFYDAADNQQWMEYSENVPRSGSYQPFEWEGGGSKLVVNAGGRLELSGTGCWGGGIHTRDTKASFTVDDCGKATGVGVCPSTPYYTLMNDTLSWGDANAACQAVGLQLASVQSAAQNALLLTAAAGNNVWIGGTDAASEDAWVWSPSNTPLSYTNWYAGQPDNGGGGGEHCLEFSWGGPGKWNDGDCTVELKCVCQNAN